MVHYYQYQGRKFEYLLIESGKPVSIFSPKKNLLFLHGINDCVQNHIEILNQLSNNGYDVYALNLPLHGKSDAINDLSWETLSDFLIQFIKDRNLYNLTMVGYSLGGAVILKSLSHLLDTEKIVLISPYCYPINLWSPLVWINMGKFILRNYYEQVRKPYGKPTPYINSIVNITLKYRHLFKENINFDLNEFKNTINMIILGKDELISAKQVEKRFREYKSISVYVLDNFSHNIYYISTDQTNVLVELILS